MMNILALWAATLSTILAVIKIWETWQGRMRLQTTYSFAGDPEEGNKVIIQNPTGTPIMIMYWELLWCRRSYLKLKSCDGRFPDEGYCDITVAPHASYSLEFRRDQHFNWGISTKGKGRLFLRLYLRLYVVGRRKPVTLMVYDPNKK